MDVVRASEGEREVETLSDEGPQGIFETQVESRGLADSEDRTDGKSCATEMENVSEVPNSSVSVEKVDGLSNEGIVGSQARMQVSEDSEAIAGDGIDVTPDCLDPLVTVEKVEGLSKEGLVCIKAKMQVSEDSEAVTGDGIDITPDCLAVPETVSIVGDSSLCSSAVGSEHVDNLSEANIDTKESEAEVDTKESEAGVCNQENQVVQEKASECMEHEKNLDDNTLAKLDSKESEAGDCNQENQEKAVKDIEKSTPVAEESNEI